MTTVLKVPEPFSNTAIFHCYNEVLFTYNCSLYQPAYEVLDNHYHQLCQIEEQTAFEMSLHDRTEITKLKVLDLLYLSWWASRMKRFDEANNELHEDMRLMTLAENLLEILPHSIAEEHCLHLHLFHIFCKMKIQKDGDQSISESRKSRSLLNSLRQKSNLLRKKCKRTLSCFSMGMLIDEFWIAMLVKMKRTNEAIALNSEIWENLESNNQFLKNKLIRKQKVSVMFVQLQLLLSQGYRPEYIEKAKSLAKRAIKEAEEVFGRMPNAFICRAHQLSALCHLICSDEPSKGDKTKAVESIAKAYAIWTELINKSPFNRINHRYLTLRLLRSLVSCDASNQPSSSEQDSKTLIQSVFDSTAGGAQDMRIDSELELWDLVEMQLNMDCKRGTESVLLLLPCVRDPIYNF